METLCSVDGCNNQARRKGWCGAHYHRWRRHGDPASGRTLLGAPGQFLEAVVIPHTGADCLAWPFARDPYGYGKISRSGRMDRVNRVVCAAVHGPAPSPEHEVAHSCGNGHGGCCNPQHLRWATHIENMADCVKHGTAARGERVSKITEADVRSIRSLRGHATQREIAARFGINQSQVCLIQTGQSWGWLDA